MTFTSFPRLGVPGVFTEPSFDPKDAVSSHSLFLPEEITNPHVRFPLVVPASGIQRWLRLFYVGPSPPISGPGDARR